MNNDTTEEIKRYFDDAVASFRADLAGVRSDLGGAVAGFRSELGGAVAGFRSDLDGAVAGLRADIQGVWLHTDALAEELRAEIRDVKRHSDVVAEGLRGEIRLVAEGVAGLDEKFTREFVHVRAEMREQIDDVKALIRAS